MATWYKISAILSQIECLHIGNPVWKHRWLPSNQQSLKWHRRGDLLFLAVTEQLYEWFSLSVCLPITPFWLCSHHGITQKFSGVITKDRGDVHAKSQGQKSKVKVTEVKTQLMCFRTVTPVWIHIWSWNECCIKLDVAKERCPILFQGHPPNFKVTRLKKIVDFYLVGAFPDCNSSLKTPMAIKWCTKL